MSDGVKIRLRGGEDQQAWEQARLAVAQRLGVHPDKLTEQTVARELADSYIGGGTGA